MSETKLSAALAASVTAGLGVVVGPVAILIVSAAGGAFLARQVVPPPAEPRWWNAPARFLQDSVAGTIGGMYLAEWGSGVLGWPASALWIGSGAVCAMCWRLVAEQLPGVVRAAAGRIGGAKP